jgi:hypothetical protein
MDKSFCEICMKNYSSYQSLWNHNKKFHKDKKCNNKNICDDNIIFVKKADFNLLQCYYCNKEFSNTSNKSRHIKTCKEIYSNIQLIETDKYKCDICNKGFNCKTSIYRHREVCKETEEHSKITNIVINNNNNVTNNNITNNNNIVINNIIINKLGEENIDSINKNDILNLFDKEFLSIIKFIELIYFNKKLPENHIFCSPNLNNKIVKIYDTALKKPKAALKNSIFNNILYNSIEKINLLYSVYKHKFDFNNDKKNIIQENIDRLQKMKYDMFNKNNKSYYVSLGLLSYNNKEIVEDTWNKIKE